MSLLPRVAVVGGGVAGSLAALGLAGCGLRPVVYDGALGGGRFGGSSLTPTADSGAQFFRASDLRFARFVALLEKRGLVAKWAGEFGMIGKRGGFLSLKNVPKDGSNDGVEEAAPTLRDSGDFCGFVGRREAPMFVGTPTNLSLCSAIAELGQFDVRQRQKVLSLERTSQKWTLRTDGGSEEYDAVVVATHDPRLAAGAVDACAHEMPGVERLESLSAALKELRRATVPVTTLVAQFPPGSVSPSFDAATSPNSAILQFIAREASKPGRAGDTWTAISTSAFSEKQGDAKEAMVAELCELLAPYTDARPDAVIKKWSAAFTDGDLAAWSQRPEASILIEPLNLGIAGDFVRRHSCPVEAAALSGLEVGDRLGAHLLSETK